MKQPEIEQQFQRFFITNFPVVKNFARMLMKSESDAEDVAQDVFLKLWMQPEIWINKENIDGYIESHGSLTWVEGVRCPEE